MTLCVENYAERNTTLCSKQWWWAVGHSGGHNETERLYINILCIYILYTQREREVEGWHMFFHDDDGPICGLRDGDNVCLCIPMCECVSVSVCVCVCVCVTPLAHAAP